MYLFSTPVLQGQGVAHYVFLHKTWVKVERNVRSGLSTAAAHEVHLKPAKKNKRLGVEFKILSSVYTILLRSQTEVQWDSAFTPSLPKATKPAAL